MALLGFLGNSQSAGRGNAIDGGEPPEDRLGADRRTASMFGHAGGQASPGRVSIRPFAAIRPGGETGSPRPDGVKPEQRFAACGVMLFSR